MASVEDEVFAGLVLCWQERERLSGASPEHELLAYSGIDNDGFFIDENRKTDFGERFGKDGQWPVGARTVAYALANYYVAMRNALAEVQSA